MIEYIHRDCYSRWKKLAITEDTALISASRINHPKKETHRLFADALYRLFSEESGADANSKVEISTMYDAK